jgi:hypothetical protein
MAVEEHGGQAIAAVQNLAEILTGCARGERHLLALASGAVLTRAGVFGIIALTAAFLTARTMQQCEHAMEISLDAVDDIHKEPDAISYDRNHPADAKKSRQSTIVDGSELIHSQE